MKYTKFIDKGNNEYEVWNIIYNYKVGIIKKARMGTWMHWQLFLDFDEIKKKLYMLFEYSKSCNELQWQDAINKLISKIDVGFSNGCLKEISAFITSLYSKK